MKRAKRLSDGGEIALTGSFRGTSTAVPLLSADEASSWLSRLDGVAIYLHDDVTCEPSDIDLLIEASAMSNAPTSAALDPTDVYGGDIPLVVGSPVVLAGLIGERAGGANRPKIEHLDSVALEHARDCAREGRRPLLVASMIVRDEADQIADCLDTLANLVDRIEIVDTGSTDETVAIARQHGASVTTSEWQQDFGAARNVALELCRDARFVLHVDADERIVTADPMAFREALASSHMRAMRIPMRNLVAGNVTSEFEAVRVFSTERTKWIGRVHEYPADVDGTPLASGRMSGLRIDHLGYDPAIVAEKDKWNRNVALAETAYQDNPTFKTRLDLARSLAWRSDDDRAFELFKEAAADLTGASESAAAFVIAHVALSHQIDGDFDVAHELALKALGHCSGEFVAHLAKARAWRARGDDQAIVEAHFDRASTELEAPMFDTAATRSMTDNLTVGAMARTGRHGDAIELAMSVLARDPARFEEWKSLASMPVQLRRSALALLASMDTTGQFVDALVGEIPMSELASLVLAHVEAQEPTSHGVITGIMAAVLSNDEPTAARIAELGVDALDAEARAATAERCRLRNATTVAGILDPQPAAV